MTLLPMSDDVRKLNADKLAGLTDAGPSKSASKFHNVRAEMKGFRFQSGHEANEMGKLMLLDEKHAIFGLRLQVKFPLPGGQSYTADAVYLEFDERINQLIAHVVDAKGMITPEYKIKAALFAERYGQSIEEV